MPLRIPQRLRSALWAHQRSAIDAMQRYFEAFDPKNAHAGLVHMPTGSGKTAVIATLARCLKADGPVVILTPRIGLREQLARDVRTRAFQHAGVQDQNLPRRVVELRDGDGDPGDLEDAVLIMTPQMLSSLQRNGGSLFKELKKSAALVLFDEGHYEPAPVWSQSARSLPCPRVVFTATPFRSDFKLFDIDLQHWFRYSYRQALADQYVREVQLHVRAPVRSPDEFARQVVADYDRLFSAPKESLADRPRAIIRCDRPEEIRQLAAAIQRCGRSVVAIHETFAEAPPQREYRKVPDPAKVDGTFWIHQFKLLEGIDDPRFQLLALYGELRSVRAFVQQVGRVIRNPKRVPDSIAHVLDHSGGGRQTRLWNSFLDYDRRVERGDPAALDLNHGALVETLQKALPGLMYVEGRFRTPAELSKLDLGSVRLPRSANIFEKPPGFSLDRVRTQIHTDCDEADVIAHCPRQTRDTLLVLHVRVGFSPLLDEEAFTEPKLGLSLVHVRGRYLFVLDVGPTFAQMAVESNPVNLSKLKKLFVRSHGSRLSRVSMLNGHVGADQIRARSITAARVDGLVPTFDEHSYVLRTAMGYTVGRGGKPDQPEGVVRRYIGSESGRVSDHSGELVSFADWASWTEELAELLDGKRHPLKTFDRWASDVPVPSDPTPRNVLLDAFDLADRYVTIDHDADAPGVPVELTDLCADVTNGQFTITANGTAATVSIGFDAESSRYLLSSPELDRRYYSTDNDSREGIMQYLNRTQSLRVVPASGGYLYTLRRFWRPHIRFGPDYDDGKMGVLSSITEIPELQQITSEKGACCAADGSAWEDGCLFQLIDGLGKGTSLKGYFDGTEILVCDDLGFESADFILVQPRTATRRRRVVFIHAKASSGGSECSAADLQEVCGQALKNLKEVSLFADSGPTKMSKWKKPWKDGRAAGSVKSRIRMCPKSVDPEEEIRRAAKDPSSDREVWIVLGNLLRKSTLERQLKKRSPPGYAIQAAYLLQSTISNVAAAGARLTIFSA